MAITKIYKGSQELENVVRIYKGSELLWEKQTIPAYLTFQSTSSFTLKTYNNIKNWDGTLYYSTDTTTWNVWSGTTTLSSVGNKLYLRGTGNTVITGNNQNYRWVLTGSNIECIGNIENLLDYETVALGNHPAMADRCYYSMFYGCTSLKVSATKTGSYQYSWRIPTSEIGTTATSWNTDMLKSTGGTFTSNPTINTTYYVENPPV